MILYSCENFALLFQLFEVKCILGYLAVPRPHKCILGKMGRARTLPVVGSELG